jgi:hypothetical protein
VNRGSSGAFHRGPSGGPQAGGRFSCTLASRLLDRIARVEQRAQKWLPRAQARESAARAAGNTALAQRIAQRISRVEGLESRGSAITGRIEARCPGSAPGGASAH